MFPDYGPYREVAERLGLSMHPPDGPGVLTFELMLTGAVDGRRVFVRRRIGKAAHVRFVVPFDPPLDLGLRLRPTGILDGIAGALGSGDVEIGSAEFDAAFVVSADEPSRARALLTGPLAEALLPDKAHDLAIDDDFAEVRFGLSWDASVEATADSLEARIRLIARTAQAVDLARRSVAPAAPLAPMVDAWTAFARDKGLSAMLAAPMQIFGQLGGVPIWAASRRRGRGKHEVEVGVRFEQPLDFPLTVSPARQGPSAWFHGEDLSLDDADFDSAFDVRSDSPDRVARLLDAETRASLVDLSRRRRVTVDARGVSIRDDATRFSPTDIPAVVDMAAELVRRMSRNYWLPPQQGYR